MIRAIAAVLVSFAATPASAEAVPVRIVWDGADTLGGILASRVRGLISASADKREAAEANPGLSVLLQTIDPAAEFGATTPRGAQMTVYSLTINVRRADEDRDAFGTAALGYCAAPDLAVCANEIVAAIDEEVERRGLRRTP